ncbi:aminodeoxychorismate synthase component I [Pseudomonas sp. HMWF032]|uniref:aminodeoxychorismate synthase component I n=1 Tax=Pseudomonas sp. HMWF032 TaxID=2056866 RepID=UPI000D3CBB8F|nr:aminodeoxychorismate synthase component I [Pseudomonas sp. HMWF032]PTS86299.1 aminodeoxychorismate synthase component I [Pseudomonas sp. HMWF032]PTT82737.1 aminodeoxychorismate synthase component I [Pseudomonas sp. HMWF010]
MPTCLVQALPYQADPSRYFSLILDAPGAVLLDAGRPTAQRGRYDLMSAWPLAELAPMPDETAKAFLQRLRQSLSELGQCQPPANTSLPFVGGIIGYLSYDFGRRLEQLPKRAFDDLGLEDARFGLYAWALITDHHQQLCHLVFHPCLAADERHRLTTLFNTLSGATPQPFRLLSPFKADTSETQYQASFARIQAYIQAGDCYQVNFAQRFRAPYEGSPWTAYQALRAACPTPFAGFQTLAQGGAIISLSPERFLRISAGQVETRPIKGTRARHADPQQDQAQADALLASRKDRAENLMIVDLLRNDLGRSCRIGSVNVPELFALESYPNVHHLVSAVTGELAADKDALDLIAGSFPGGSITGAPKIRAMQIIDELEPNRRALYCGSLLYLDVRGEMDSSIAIRSLLAKDGQISCWGGGGIVADSDCQAEYQESITKVRVLLDTLQQLS